MITRRSRPAASRGRIAALGCALVLVLAGCSSGSEPTLKTGAAPTAAGRKYSYDAGSVPRSGWPDPCRLLTASDASTVLGTRLVVHRFHNQCMFLPTSALFPTLTLSLIGVGNAQAGTYRANLAHHAGGSGVAVRGVGQAATFAKVSGQPAYRLDVLAGQATFELTLRSPSANPVNRTPAQSTLVTVGRLVAAKFSS